LGGSVLAFAALSAAAASASAPPAWLATLFLGLASGVFNVSSLALMFTMADRRRAALFMGAWTLAHALADGSATAGGGAVFELAHRVFGSVPGGYAAVFGIEAIGLLICIPLLRLVDPARFAREAEGEMPMLVAEAALAGAEGGALLLEAEPVQENGATRTAAKKKPATKSGRATRA
jgi:MFS transporter, BCD family, chlorophyll transporter